MTLGEAFPAVLTELLSISRPDCLRRWMHRLQRAAIASVRYDEVADTAYVALSPVPTAGGATAAAGVPVSTVVGGYYDLVVDEDADGQVLGVSIQYPAELRRELAAFRN